MQESIYTLVDDIWILVQRSLVDLALTHRHGPTSRDEWERIQDMNLLMLSMRRINILNGKTKQGQEAFVAKIDEFDHLAHNAIRLTAGHDPPSLTRLIEELTLFKRSLSVYVCGSAWHWIL